MTAEATFDLGNELTLRAVLEPERPSPHEETELSVRLVSGHDQVFDALSVRSYLVGGGPTEWLSMEPIKIGGSRARNESHFSGRLQMVSGVNRIEFLEPSTDCVRIDWTLAVSDVEPGGREAWIESSSAFTWYERLIRRDPASAREPIDRLIQEHGTANIRNEAGVSILAEACRWGDVPLVRDLLAHHADPDGGGVSPPIAAARGKSELIGTLIEAGCDVNASDVDGKTALMDAVAYADFESIRLLLAAGAESRAIDRGGRTAIDYTRKKNGDANAEVLRLLDTADGDNRSP